MILRNLRTENIFRVCLLSGLAILASPLPGLAQPADKELANISGVYPHLAVWNHHNECGIGAVVPWADQLWVMTYPPHKPNGSSDRLYSISPDLEITPFADSVGGTHANRMIHRETSQLIIGPYVIDEDGQVRVIPREQMPGRLTGNARHLTTPDEKVYYATMEEGIYEVDMRSLEVVELFRDHQKQAYGGNGANDSKIKIASLPGYHGKGLYSGQGRLIYANNGENSEEARSRPDVESGCLAEWDGSSDSWSIVRRNQFTEVRGPGGLYGNTNPDTDPVWSIGWDDRSLLLKALDNGKWQTWRLPKASHAYDGAHGWNTEWPRIRDIGDEFGGDLLMNMHGMLWRFPKAFSHNDSGGIAPRSTCLKVFGDFCRWKDHIVFGCDDSAKSEFLNKRRAKGNIAGPGQSHSNLWFVSPSQLDQLGVPIGRGAVWVDSGVNVDERSDPYLFDGFDQRGAHISHEHSGPVTFVFEVNVAGHGIWEPLKTVTVEPGVSVWHSFLPTERGAWIRVYVDTHCSATVQFHYSGTDHRTSEADPIFAGLATPTTERVSSGLVHSRGGNLKTLGFVGQVVDASGSSKATFYELDAQMNLKPIVDDEAIKWSARKLAIPKDILTIDDASVLYIDDKGQRWRLPKGDAAFDSDGLSCPERISREVVTERDLFNCHGTFYELPAINAGGFAKIRPICTHNRRIKDYCSYRGLLIMSGIDVNSPADNPHIIRSEDGAVALWAGVVDDLWKFGKPIGAGGPWRNSEVAIGVPSDPYLMTGYDRMSLQLSHQAGQNITLTAEIDITGNGKWVVYTEFDVPAGESVNHEFPRGFGAYWIRFKASKDTSATAILTYE